MGEPYGTPFLSKVLLFLFIKLPHFIEVHFYNMKVVSNNINISHVSKDSFLLFTFSHRFL